MSENKPSADFAKMKVGNERLKLRDNAGRPAYVDTICEAGASNGIVLLSLGAFMQNNFHEPEIEIVTRLRFNASTARSIHMFLGQYLDEMQKQMMMQKPETEGRKAAPN